jgi:hypothetical protein
VQLGTRWRVGANAPATLPAVVAASVRDVEQELAVASVDTTGWGWTLTYLEGRPVVELDDGTRIDYLAEDDRAVVRPAVFDEPAATD